MGKKLYLGLTNLESKIKVNSIPQASENFNRGFEFSKRALDMFQ